MSKYELSQLFAFTNCADRISQITCSFTAAKTRQIVHDGDALVNGCLIGANNCAGVSEVTVSGTVNDVAQLLREVAPQAYITIAIRARFAYDLYLIHANDL